MGIDLRLSEIMSSRGLSRFMMKRVQDKLRLNYNGRTDSEDKGQRRREVECLCKRDRKPS